MRLLPPLIVVSALLGGCNTTGSLPSTGSSERGADEAADPACTLLLVADSATPLQVGRGFPLNRSWFCWTTLSVVWAAVGAGVWAGTRPSLCPHVHKEVLPIRNPKNQKEQRTKSEHEKNSRCFLGGIQCTWYLFGGIQYRRYRLGDVQGQRYLLGGIQSWRYLLGGIESWRYSFGGIESWLYVLAVSGVGGTFCDESGKTKIWRYLLGGNAIRR